MNKCIECGHTEESHSPNCGALDAAGDVCDCSCYKSKIIQRAGTRLCGQIAVANIAEVSLEASIRVFGHKHGTTMKAVIKALKRFGFDVPYPHLQRRTTMPELAIGKMRWRKPDGNLRGWHWVAIKDGVVMDGLEHSIPGEVTSYLVIIK